MILDENADSEERGRAIVQTLAVVVESMVHASERMPLGYYHKTKFEAFRAPGISIRDYLMRIHKYASCSPECFVLALVYMDRLHQMQGFVLTELNVHRVVITSIVLAAKFFDDHYFNNAYYAKVGGVPCPEMNELEVEYLLLINFSLHVSSETYARYYNELANHYMFTRVRNATLPQSPYYQLRHFVAPDPQHEGQLAYVTESYPKVPQEHRRKG
ncbi:hypothetical protein BBO99_00004576 [Phytophthora kernoviae]|uniref:Cyclin n=2 Tax=Phytophthora kernoviae TaxID=325452 RepID=A0A3F2RG52_9STRA|nr:hypothetical protein G195_005250 [Phytophthora kernoviae 00238/432]KAG2522463.1 hypothetical protein JM18_006126 [Phytophthora kernoviae]KAG2524915.1 hypothetical protein JM16_004608 [Phytophthora kernoviae]RLN44781.1 hypothetical protein BBI17_005042 [Phytophthora kernoviae]RLN56099.1 hypothetical protein BBP00_00008174 [Phytophthora kernoviae]